MAGSTGSGSPALNGSLPPSAGGSPAFGTTPEEEAAARRAASPTGSQRKVSNGSGIGLGHPNSFGQVGQQAQQQNGRPAVAVPAAQQASKIAKRATTGGAGGAPTRPARPDEELSSSGNRRTMDPASAPRYEDRSMSPTGGSGVLIGAQQPRIASASSRNASPGLASPTSTGSARGGGGGGSNKGTPPLAQGGFAGQQAASAMLGRSQSPSQHPLPESIEGHSDLASSTTLAPNGPSASPPQDAFYYGSRGSSNTTSANAGVDHSAALKAKEEEIAQLKSREGWMRSALSAAARKGFVAPPLQQQKREVKEGEEKEEGEGEKQDEFAALAKASEEGPNKEVVEALLAVKKELAQAKVSSSSLSLFARRES
jgi:hypothetical protein